MTAYEMRTYTLHVGKMAEAVKLYAELGSPVPEKGDTGMINKVIHLWKFADDADCRAYWAATVVRRRFERLCRFLADHYDRYATAVFSRTHPENLLGADGVAPLGRYV